MSSDWSVKHTISRRQSIQNNYSTCLKFLVKENEKTPVCKVKKVGDLFVGRGSYPSVKIENRLNQGCGGVRFRRDTELYEEIFQPIRGQYCDAMPNQMPSL